MALILFFMSTTVYATTSAMFDKVHATPGKKEFSPYVNRSYPTQVYFGDTHLHTSLSMDAGTFGNRLGLDDAYTFVRGGTVTASKGFKAKLGEPLDFVVIADHSDGMGFFDMFAGGDPDFDPAQRAFYYARVIEIPTPRWTAYEAMRFGIKMPAEAEMVTQERAYTSPIWYTP